MALRASWDTICAHLARLRRPVMRRLQPGLTRAELARRTAALPFALPRELQALYRLTGGTEAPAGVRLDALWLFPGYFLLSLDEAIRVQRQQRRARGWRDSWFPVFASGAGDFYVVPCVRRDGAGVVGYLRGEPEHEVEYRSLTAMFATLAACFARGAFVVRRGTFTIDDAKHARIARALNPGLAAWQPDDEDEELRARAAASALAKRASRLMMKGRVFEALELFEQALAVPELPEYAYVNALYCVQSGNNKRPVDRARIRKVLAACIPYADREPDIWLNAAFAYLELGKLDDCIASFERARRGGVNLAPHLREPALARFANDPRVVALGRRGNTRSRAR